MSHLQSASYIMTGDTRILDAFKTDEEKEWLKLDVTTSDVQANCEDLKVLGKGDFKALLKWRTSLREEVAPIARLNSRISY